MYLIDYHTHTIASPDAEDSALKLCEFAVRAGLCEIALTDHFESNGFWQDGFEYDNVYAFTQTQAARKAFGDSIKILHGVEIGQPIHNDSAALALLEKQSFDFIIGSVHNLRGLPDFYFLDYTKMTAEDVIGLFDRYLDELLELASWRHFDVLGHITYPLQYFSANGFDLRIRDFEEKLRLILKTVIDNGMGIEVNASGLRKMGKTMPDFWTVRLYRELGGEVITIGSDAHTASQVGRGIKIAAEMIQQAGFKYLTTFFGRKKTMVEIGRP